MLRFDGDRAGRVALEERGHRLAQVFKGGNLDAGLLQELLRVQIAPREVRPGDVVEKEVRTGLIGPARPLEVVDLDVIETRELAQQPEPFAGPSQLLQLPLRSLEAVRCQRIEAVYLAGDQPNRLAVARVLRCLPCVTDPRKASPDVAGGRIEQTLNRRLRRAGNLQITRHVVQEQILEDVGSGVVHPGWPSFRISSIIVALSPAHCSSPRRCSCVSTRASELISRPRSVCVSTDDSLR